MSSKALALIIASYGDEGEQPEEEPKMQVKYDDDGLPPEPTNSCPKDLQDNITELYAQMQNGGRDMNDVIRNSKVYRNRSMYEKLVDFYDLDEFGTNYPAEIYDPLKWGKESYYDELAKVQEAEMEKREKKRKEKTKVEIVSGTAKKATSTKDSISSSILPSADGEKRRKTKWDQALFCQYKYCK